MDAVPVFDRADCPLWWLRAFLPTDKAVMRNPSIRPWLVLRAIEGVGDATLLKLLDIFGNPDAVLCASEDDLIHGGCLQPLARAIRRGLTSEANHRIDQELRALKRLGVNVISYLDERYPARLRMIEDPPAILYVSGGFDACDEHAIAIVGARRASHEGRLVTEELSRDLALAGFTVVSGLARGVDAAAHRGALSVNGRTLAVLGCGIDRTYPIEHATLRREIERHGAVISELPLGAPPHSYHFPRRNRLISGLSHGVVVTEAALNSGSLITASLAADQGREVFALPGFVKSDTSRGPNGLIKEGAKLVESADDVITELLPQLDESFRTKVRNRDSYVPNSPRRFGKEETLVYDALSYEPQQMDSVIEKTGLSVSAVATVLLTLELRNCVRQLPGHLYLRL